MKALKTGLLLLLVTSLSMGADEEDAPVIMTANGQISGLKEESTNGHPFFSYYSIPYAQPPVGDLRFKHPVKVSNWDGVKDCSKAPPMCPQYVCFGTPICPPLTGEEDCLFLNVFTAKPNEEMLRLPIMVFIHGGAFFLGSSEEYPPHVMMNHDIVFVTIQYRLGMLGFLSTEDAEAPGNMGLRDQTMALSWIQNNAHMFGGDPLKITIFGESAGAASVHWQILSPRAIGLFNRAILMSGSALYPYASGGAFREAAEYTAAMFNCTTDDGSKKIISCLQGISVEELLPIQKHFNLWHINPTFFAPRVDGDFIPADPETLLKESRHKRIDLISGITSHEGGFYTIPTYANEVYRTALMLNFPEIGPISLELKEGDPSPMNLTAKIFDRYIGGVNLDADNADDLTLMFSDRYFNIPHDLTSSIHAKNVRRNKKNVFRYELTHRGQRSLMDDFGQDIGKHYVSHGDDLYYLFSGGEFFAPLETEDDLKMREIMTTLWVNFATHGDPTPDDTLGFKWDPVTRDHMPHLNLKPSPTMEEDYRAETREFWASLPLKTNLILHPERVSNLTVVSREEAAREEGVLDIALKLIKDEVVKEEVVKDEIKPQESAEEKETKESEKEINKKDEL